MGLVQSIEGLKQTRLRSPRKEGIVLPEAFGSHAATPILPWVSSLPSCPANPRSVSFYNHMSQLLKINHSLSTPPPPRHIPTHILSVLLLRKTLTNIFTQTWTFDEQFYPWLARERLLNKLGNKSHTEDGRAGSWKESTSFMAHWALN